MLAKAWRDHYIGIQQANIVLNRITPVAMDSQIKNYRIGEMKFLRALMYFDLVRIFGDIPLSTEETTNVNNYFGKGRNTTTEVYAFIVKRINRGYLFTSCHRSSERKSYKKEPHWEYWQKFSSPMESTMKQFPI